MMILLWLFVILSLLGFMGNASEVHKHHSRPGQEQVRHHALQQHSLQGAVDIHSVNHKRATIHPPHQRRFVAFTQLFCEDPDSQQFFPWRMQWKWPHCPYVSTKYEESLGRKVVPKQAIIPIFVLFRDKWTHMKELLRSLHETISSSFQVVVIETNSRLPEAIVFVEWLREHHVPVVFTTPANDTLQSVQEVIHSYLEEHPEYLHYVIATSDISFHGAHPNLMNVMVNILQVLPSAVSVSPGIRVDDLPPGAIRLPALDKLLWRPAQANTTSLSSTLNVTHFTASIVQPYFSIFRRDFVLQSESVEEIRMTNLFEIRQLDLYYTKDSEMPTDVRLYNCLQSLSVETSDCRQLLNQHNITLPINKDSEVVNTMLDEERIHRAIGDVPLHVKVGALPKDYARFTHRRMKSTHQSNQSSTSSSSSTSALGMHPHHGFWMEINPFANAFLLTERHLTLPFLAAPTESNSPTRKLTFYKHRSQTTCSSMFTTPNMSDAEQFAQLYASTCHRVEAEYGSDKMYLHEEKTTAALSVERHWKDSYDCLSSQHMIKTKTAAISLALVLSRLHLFSIQLLDIDSKGADASLLYSIAEYLPNIRRVKCDCFRGSSSKQYLPSEVENNCDDIASYLRKHDFAIDYIRVKNCGIEEFTLRASKKLSSASAALALAHSHGSTATHSHDAAHSHSSAVASSWHYTTTFVVRVSSVQDWSDFAHQLKPSLDAFVNKRYFHVLLLANNITTTAETAHLDTNHYASTGIAVPHGQHASSFPITIRNLQKKHEAVDRWIYFIDHYVDSSSDIVGVLKAADIFHTFLTVQSMMDDDGSLLNVAVLSPQTATGEPHHNIPKLDDLYDTAVVDQGPKLFFRSTFQHLRDYVAKQFRAESFESTYEAEKYKAVLPSDAVGMVMLVSTDSSVDRHWACCHSYGTYGGKECSQNEQQLQQESKHLLQWRLMNQTTLNPKFANKLSLLSDHYNAVKLAVKKMNRLHVKRLSQSCSRLD